MNGLKRGDKVGAKIYGEWCCVTVESVGRRAAGTYATVRHKDGSTHQRSAKSLIGVEDLLSIAEEILSETPCIPDYVYITKGPNETGCSVSIGTKLTVVDATEHSDGRRLKVKGPCGEDWHLSPDWYTIDEEELPF